MSDLRDWVAARAAHDILRQRLFRQVPVAAPAAGADWTITVPAGVVWEVLFVRHVLTTSAVVANRTAALNFRDADGTQLGRLTPVSTQAASLGVSYSWWQGLGTEHNQVEQNMSLPSPPIPYSAGYIIRSLTTNIDVGDQYAGVFLFVREWSAAQVGQHLEKILGDELFATYADREV